MKNIFFLALILISYSYNAQDSIDTTNTTDKFHYSIEGLVPEFIVTTVPGTQAEIYQKSINWIKETYKNPDAVINTTIENEKIKITGSTTITVFAIASKTQFDVIYVIELSFKEGRYRFLPLSLRSASTDGSEISLKDGSKYYRKNGDIRTTYQYFPKDIEDLFNGLNQSLNNYLNKTDVDNNDDW